MITGRHQRCVRDFVRRHASRLNAAPSAFVSVCGAAAGTSREEQAEAQGYADEFLRRTGWRPRLTATFAGAIRYTRYGFFTRWIMKRIARRRGRPTDTTRDYEFTDWDAVDRVARMLHDTLRQPAETVRG